MERIRESNETWRINLEVQKSIKCCYRNKENRKKQIHNKKYFLKLKEISDYKDTPSAKQVNDTDRTSW